MQNLHLRDLEQVQAFERERAQSYARWRRNRRWRQVRTWVYGLGFLTVFLGLLLDQVPVQPIGLAVSVAVWLIDELVVRRWLATRDATWDRDQLANEVRAAAFAWCEIRGAQAQINSRLRELELPPTVLVPDDVYDAVDRTVAALASDQRP